MTPSAFNLKQSNYLCSLGKRKKLIVFWLHGESSGLSLEAVPRLHASFRLFTKLKASLQAGFGAGMVLVLACASVGPLKAIDQEPWVDCLYNRKSMSCRRTFLCKDAPCDKFRLEWKDGVKETYRRYKDGVVPNVGFYQDVQGGEWMLRGFADSFALVNESNGNTIIYGMTLLQCSNSGLSDLCFQ